MPTYCYRTDDGEIHDIRMGWNEEHPDEITLDDGRVAKRSLSAEGRGGVVGMRSSTWPMVSEGMAVHESQIEEAKEHARKHGVPTDFDRLGRPILTGPMHRKRYAESRGFHDNNAGYGDPQRR